MGALLDFLAAVAPSLVVAVLAALLGVRLALRRFRSERWWERKAEAYTDLISAVYRFSTTFDRDYVDPDDLEELDAQGPLTQRGFIGMSRAQRRRNRAWAEIEQAIGIGEFVFSRETVLILSSLKTRVRQGQPGDRDGDRLEAARLLLQRLKAAAARDLGVETQTRP
ncbi:hypothetical protein [Rubrivirga sp. IMCC45206]|uniref:hypothetical protein n=1 Tax=Rubrivirga sp. IMCC45206 TaxID=3391614 RepID=UPI00399033CD